MEASARPAIVQRDAPGVTGRPASRIGLALALAASPLLLAAPLRGELPASAYLPLHLLVELLVASLGLAAFAVQWSAAGVPGAGEARGRVLGAAALAMAALEACHLLVSPGMPGLLGPSSIERAIRYWIAARVVLAVPLVASAWIPADAAARASRRGPLTAAAVGLVAAIVAVEAALPPGAGAPDVAGGGLTGRTLAVEVALGALAAAGAILHLRRHRATGDATLLWTAAALGCLVLASACPGAFAAAHDGLDLLGRAYAAAASWSLFRALSVAALLEPHARLEAASARLEETRRGAATHAAELQALRAEREDLLRAVSHDLRNPLQIVLLQGERVQRLAPPDALKERKAADAICAAAKLMGAMIRDLVEAVRLDPGRLALAREPLDLARWLPERLERQAGALDVARVAVAVEPGVPPVLADASRLERVVANLLANALAYSQPPAPVRVTTALRDGAVVVSVSDRGAGIAPEDVPRLFQRFQRGRLAQRSDGLGLGLYVVRTLVEAHGGRVWVESVPGEGSTFSFTLPVAQVARGAPVPRPP